MWVWAKNVAAWISGLVQKNWADTEYCILRLAKKKGGGRSFEAAAKDSREHYIQRLKKEWKFYVLPNTETKENCKKR